MAYIDDSSTMLSRTEAYRMLVTKVELAMDEAKNEVKYVDTKGDTMSGTLNMGGFTTINIANTTDEFSAATRGYVLEKHRAMTRYVNTEIQKLKLKQSAEVAAPATTQSVSQNLTPTVSQKVTPPKLHHHQLQFQW
jgi:hypothetical protein